MKVFSIDEFFSIGEWYIKIKKIKNRQYEMKNYFFSFHTVFETKLPPTKN